MRWIQQVQQIAAGLLLLVGFLCLGRVLETTLDSNPNRVDRRETITAGIVVGVPAIAGGVGLILAAQHQRRRQESERLQGVFFALVKAGRGKVTPLRFAMEAKLTGVQATAYLGDRAREYDATFQVDSEGGITYCFNLGEVDSRLLRSTPEPTFTVVLETVPPAQRRDIIRTLQRLTGKDWKTVKAMVRNPPQPIQVGLSRAIAEDYKQDLERLGAEVVLVLDTD
ncbi:ribosomal protein L7/L12 [Leptolyngbya sp. PCC 6406]|uniref:ribosomal protein L7/L12 n=1 Tax=Leptolyngbya sp. PCC 6406 TaxID=1173264 RepID=UPI0002ABCC12|nr:ribosomal protein L7/L12 [Leptolyngbya sp. PCC 6406]